MIRITLILLLIIAVFIGLVLFPNIANQPVRIEMLGWLFETRTGMFTLLLLFVFSVFWSVQKILVLSINSPKQLWSNLRSGSKKRQDQRLQKALTLWIDEGEGHSQKLLKRCKSVLPTWLHQSLLIWWDTPSAHAKINDEKDEPLVIALKARLATDPNQQTSLNSNSRQQYLDAWLSVHPAAPLALQRKAELLGALGEHAEQVSLLEGLVDRKKQIHTLKPLLAQALQALAQQDSQNKLLHLRKAHRLTPASAGILIDLALALAEAGDQKSSARMLLDYLERHDDMQVAEIALKVLSSQPLSNFKLVDKPSFQQTMAGSWLRVCLAYEADLIGLAEDGLQTLLERSPSALLWQTRGDWFAETQQWQQATESYQEALALNNQRE